MAQTEDPRRQLPGVDALLAHPLVINRSGQASPEILASIIRDILSVARDRIAAGKPAPSHDDLATAVLREVSALANAAPRRVINATGVILHTGLGRAPLCDEAVAAIMKAARYADVEFDLASGDRGDRTRHVEALLTRITGAEAAFVVNNNAAALYLGLNVLGYRQEVIVSRGQLIEIGGSFRLPDIMARSGVKLVEVGTTNRTRLDDYRAAITERTALLLAAHPSNYRISGFTESVSIEALAALGKERGIPVVDDVGNGLLWDWSNLGLPPEPCVAASLAAGSDLVLVSGDKALGGPQCGIILGSKSLVTRLKKNALARVLRTDKLTLSALDATLRAYLDRSQLARRIPFWSMLTAPLDELRARAARLKRRIRAARAVANARNM